MMNRIAFAALALTACTDPDAVPVTDLQHTPVGVEIDYFPADPYIPAGQFTVTLSKFGDDPGVNAAKATDCLELGSSTQVRVGGVVATTDYLGGFDDGGWSFESNCGNPYFTIDLGATPPATIDFKIADDSAVKHVVLQSDGKGRYTVARCDAASCDLLQSPPE